MNQPINQKIIYRPGWPHVFEAEVGIVQVLKEGWEVQVLDDRYKDFILAQLLRGWGNEGER